MMLWNEQYLRHPIQLHPELPPAAGMAIEKIASGQMPRIDRRRVPRRICRTRAWLEPLDHTGPLRNPIIYTRDVDQFGAGYIAQHDVSAVGKAILHLPITGSRPMRLPCTVRRCRELMNGWFEGVVDFKDVQMKLMAMTTPS